jgi:phage terminase large subunit-like protein
MVEFRQGYVSMNEPTKALLGGLANGTIRHGGHPVLRWMASNAAKKEDPAGNIKPDKAASGEKIDGIVATIMGLGLALRQISQQAPSLILC